MDEGPGEEAIEEDDVACQECVAPRILLDPGQPTQKQLDDHRVDHEVDITWQVAGECRPLGPLLLVSQICDKEEHTETFDARRVGVRDAKGRIVCVCVCSPEKGTYIEVG